MNKWLHNMSSDIESHTVNEIIDRPRLSYAPSIVFDTLADLGQSFIKLPKLARRRRRGYLFLHFSTSRSSGRRRFERAKTTCSQRDALEVALPNFVRRGVHARLLRTPDPHYALEEMPHRHAEDDVPMAGGKRDEQGARDQGAGRHARGRVVVEEKDERRVGQGGEPREEGEAAEPWPDRVGALWERAAEVCDHLECIGAELDDIVE